eukprot:ANDGO_02734.mRNA.1 hypothetical protein
MYQKPATVIRLGPGTTASIDAPSEDAPAPFYRQSASANEWQQPLTTSPRSAGGTGASASIFQVRKSLPATNAQRVGTSGDLPTYSEPRLPEHEMSVSISLPTSAASLSPGEAGATAGENGRKVGEQEKTQHNELAPKVLRLECRHPKSARMYSETLRSRPQTDASTRGDFSRSTYVFDSPESAKDLPDRNFAELWIESRSIAAPGQAESTRNAGKLSFSDPNKRAASASRSTNCSLQINAEGTQSSRTKPELKQLHIITSRIVPAVVNPPRPAPAVAPASPDSK